MGTCGRDTTWEGRGVDDVDDGDDVWVVQNSGEWDGGGGENGGSKWCCIAIFLEIFGYNSRDFGGEEVGIVAGTEDWYRGYNILGFRRILNNITWMNWHDER